MATKNIEIQDSTGNIYYPHTDASIVKFGDSNVNATLSDLVKNISNDVILTPSMNYGMNNKITNTGEVTNSPTFTIKGKTVVNLLGKDGNCEDLSKWGDYQCTHSLDYTNKVFGNNSIKIILTSTLGNIYNITLQGKLDVTKYYFISAYIKNGNASNVKLTKQGISGGSNISSSLITDTTKFNRVGIVVQPSDFGTTDVISIMLQGSSGQYAYVDGIMLNEITASEYALGVNTLLANYPYVDSYACLQNPYIEVKHNNLVRNGNGEEGTSWWSNINGGNADSASTLSIINGKLALTQTNSASHWYTQKVKVKPNTNYYLKSTLSDSTNSYINVTDPLNSVSLFTNNNGTFNTNSYDEICINIQTKGSSPAGTYYFSSIILIEGTTAPSSNRPCVIERTVLETKLTSDDTIVYKNGEVTGQIWWKHKTLFGKDYDWIFGQDYTGYKQLWIELNLPIVGNQGISVKYDGKILSPFSGTPAISDLMTISQSNGNISVTVSDSNTGWTETINPNNDEVKAFMNGWKAIYNDSTRYCGWVSVIDGSVPSGSANSSITATSSGTTVTVADGTKFVASDNLDIVSSTGTVKANIQISSISGNVLTLNRSVSVVTGDVVMKLNSEMVTWCKNNVAPGYEGYQLHYKLKSPESINDNNCIIHGDIPLFDVGDNYLYLDSGIVLNEITTPIYDGSNYDIGRNQSGVQSLLSYKNENILAVYKDKKYDNVWSNARDNYWGQGRDLFYTVFANIDFEAIYTVDYKILTTQAPHIGTISCSYSQDINSTISNIQESLNSKQTHNSLLDQIVDKSLYEKINYVLRARPAALVTNSCRICLPLTFSTKKCIPTVTIDSQTFVARTDNVGGYTVLNNSDVTVVVALYSNQNATVYITYVGNNAIINNNLMAYGIEASFNITLDCRGRI